MSRQADHAGEIIAAACQDRAAAKIIIWRRAGITESAKAKAHPGRTRADRNREPQPTTAANPPSLHAHLPTESVLVKTRLSRRGERPYLPVLCWTLVRCLVQRRIGGGRSGLAKACKA